MQDVSASSLTKTQGTRPKARGGVLGCLTKFMPTNYNMLIFRTMNRDMHQANANEDNIAFLFRNRLMPVRSSINKCIPSCLSAYKHVTEHPKHGSPGTANYIDARTQWFDQAVASAKQQGITQVVIIAAGFDSRAYRLHTSGLKFYEIDLPHASIIKQKLVDKVLPDAAKHPRPVFVGADLSECSLKHALHGTGFDPVKPSLFLCEGLLYYLPQYAVDKLISDVAALAAPGSLFYFDFLHLDVLEGRSAAVGYDNTAKVVAIKGEPFLSGMHPSAACLCKTLAQQDLRLREVLSPREILAKFLPHIAWDEQRTQILPFYSFAAVQRPA
ncbi:hypothetical protein ABBQ38_014640 [Trebouxia sp. C0009 RCD-2024]